MPVLSDIPFFAEVQPVPDVVVLAAGLAGFGKFAQTQRMVHPGQFYSGTDRYNAHEVRAEGLRKIGHGFPNPDMFDVQKMRSTALIPGRLRPIWVQIAFQSIE